MIEAPAEQLRAREQLAQRRDGVVDSVRRNQIRFAPVPAPPCHEARDVVVGDLGQELVLAEEVEHEAEQGPCVRRARKVLRMFRPVATGEIVEFERRAGALDLRDVLLGPLTLGRLYLFGFASRRLFRRAVKAITSPPKIE